MNRSLRNLLALSALLLATTGCRGSGTTIQSTSSEDDGGKSSSWAHIADGEGRFECRASATGNCNYVLYVQQCAPDAPLAGCSAVVPTQAPPNGQLGDDQLCSIGDGQQLRADAAATFVAMDTAYTAAFGSSVCITDSYRSYGSQQSVYWRKPGLAAVPGTSNHGWGVAVDVFCGIDDYSSAEHAWLTEHGDEYGWINPEWAQAGGSRPEPWHWEFDPALLG
jgi:hypothetical protein